MIEHIVLSGGGPNGLVQMGVIVELMRSGKMDPCGIKSVYGTSIGSFIGIILALGIPLEEYCEYIVERPWNKWVDIHYADANTLRGFIPCETLKDLVRPMLKAHGFHENITLKEAYDLTNIDVHMFTVELDTFTLVDLNHATFPHLSMMQAACMSSALFPVFSPMVFEGKSYIDGGARNNFPLDMLLATKVDPDTVLGLNLVGDGSTGKYSSQMTGVETMMYILFKTAYEMGCIEKTHKLGQTCTYYLGITNRSVIASTDLWGSSLGDTGYRRQLLNDGLQLGKEFIGEKWPV